MEEEDIVKKWNKVGYYYDETIGCYNYYNSHPMKPFRVAMTDSLIKAYKMDTKMTSFDRDYVEEYMFEVNDKLLTQFHSDEYINLIKIIQPSNRCQHEDQLYRFNFGEDCPVMEKLYEFCLTYASGSVAGANLLRHNKIERAINWSGGLHHAKQSEASGFCYVNDCNLAILELLRTYQRVLYIDIDIHHGDGVEEAFYLTDRVMTCSLHKFKDYFPGTGHKDDIGFKKGKYHAVNFPLSEGMDDESYMGIFKPVIDAIYEYYKPEAVVLQCGADSLSGDRLGCFNLSVKGHGECVKYIKEKNVPFLTIGGGGYTLRNIPRCWTYETSINCDVELQNELPDHDFLHYFSPEYKLHMPISNMENTNTKEYMEEIKQFIIQNMRNIANNTSGVHIDNHIDSRFDIKDVDASEILSRVSDKKQEREDRPKLIDSMRPEEN